MKKYFDFCTAGGYQKVTHIKIQRNLFFNSLLLVIKCFFEFCLTLHTCILSVILNACQLWGGGGIKLNVCPFHPTHLQRKMNKDYSIHFIKLDLELSKTCTSTLSN